jgi:Uroporphyrinogen decarboxylase (URO-D)
MGENSTPRQMVKALLKGVVPPRPLFLPIVFSLGSRIENLSLRNFLVNPTKICNALLQIRRHLRADGVTCYFDSLLELEALGCELLWEKEDASPSVRWSPTASAGKLAEDLRPAEQIAAAGHVPVALEVIRRMNAVGNREFLLAAGVAGPFTLAARLTRLEQRENLNAGDFSDHALELAGSALTQISTAFVEAGADLIFIHEEIIPALSAKECAAWSSLLAPAINTIRFYEALPVLLCTNGRSFAINCDLVLRQPWECVVCAPPEGFASCRPAGLAASSIAPIGIAFPLEAFQRAASFGEDSVKLISSMISEWRVAILTTAGEVPLSVDLKRLARVMEEVPRAV